MKQKINTRTYQICSRCVMDTTDPDIVFDERGVCNHCHIYDELVRANVFTGEEGKKRLVKIVAEIKKAGKGKDYDCLIGVSGGVDSSFLAYKVRELGLRPLAVHLDNGWDSELAVKNIELILKKLNIDLYTHVLDWEEFKDLQLAFLKAGTPDSEIPTDHAIISLLYLIAEKKRIRYVLSGFNLRTETHIPLAWSQGHMDWKYVKSVHRKYGRSVLKTFPHLNLYQYKIYARKQKWIHILNYFDYVRSDAKNILKNDLCWKDYGSKHYESIYTRFYQGYILPTRFGYDKRRSHYSSLICSGQITRESVLKDLKNEIYPIEMQIKDKEYVIKKLGLNEQEFEKIMTGPKKSYWDYPSYGKLYNTLIYKTARSIYIKFIK
jgi:N-acetyl sugar amidotransferase